MANYMEQVAKMLGVELYEEFEIVFPVSYTCHATAMFTDEGIKVISTDVYDSYNFKAYVLTHLLNGNYGIKRKPWKPKDGEEYYCIEMLYGDAVCNHWRGLWMDVMYYKVGNCYRTKEEAEANRAKWFIFYKSDEVLEV